MLHETMAAQGIWLFRWRSYLPFAIIAPFAYEAQYYRWPMSSHGVQELWEIICLCVSLLGLAIRCHVAGHVPFGTSGRNTRSQQAMSLNTSGLYSVVRNPLYLGNFLMWLGIAMMCPMWSFITVFALVFWLYYERIILAEEQFLLANFGESYRTWARDTPAFWPAWRRWQSPDLTFSLKSMLRREYTGILGIGCGWALVHTFAHWMVEDQLVVEWRLVAVLTLSLLAYLLLRFLKKHTALLDVAGR